MYSFSMSARQVDRIASNCTVGVEWFDEDGYDASPDIFKKLTEATQVGGTICCFCLSLFVMCLFIISCSISC